MGSQIVTDLPERAVPTIMPAGLTTAEAGRRRAEQGLYRHRRSAGALANLLAKFWSPVPWMLEAAILLQLWLGQYIEAGVIGALLLFNATLGFIQEGRAGAALAALKKRLAATALVRRDGEWTVFRLGTRSRRRDPSAARSTGSGRCNDHVRVGDDQSVDANRRIRSGRSGARQQCLHRFASASRPGDRRSDSTGAKTYFGRTAELVRIAHAISTEQRAIFGVTRNLAIINGVVAALIIVYAYLSPSCRRANSSRSDRLLATIPLALPATFTLSAAFGAQLLSRHGVLLTRLTAVQKPPPWMSYVRTRPGP